MNFIGFITNKYFKTAALLAAVILLPVIFRTPMNMRIMIEIGIFSILVLGLNLLMGMAGQVSMGHAGIFGLAAYVTGLLSSGRLPFITLPVMLSIPVAVVITTLISFLIAYPILKLKGHYLAMGTLALGIISYTIFVNIPFGGGFDGFSGIPRMWLVSEDFSRDILKINKYLNGYFIVYLVLLALIWISGNIQRSKIGRAFKAIHTSEIAASSLGIDVTTYKVMVFTLSGFYAAIAGVLFAHFYCGVTPGDFSIVKSITLVTMVVIGGSGSIWGAVSGAAFLIMINYILEVFQGLFEKAGIKIALMDFNIVIYGLIFLLALLFMPEGFTGLKGKIFSAIKRMPGTKKAAT